MLKNANRRIKKLILANDGKLPTYAWPGGYPMFYFDAENNVLCPACAAQNDEFSAPIVEYDVNYEEPHLYCDHCSANIPAAYGDTAEDDVCIDLGLY